MYGETSENENITFSQHPSNYTYVIYVRSDSRTVTVIYWELGAKKKTEKPKQINVIIVEL